MYSKTILKTTLKNTLYAGGILALYFTMLSLMDINFLKFQFFTFLVQAAVLLIFAFKNISELRLQSENMEIKYHVAFTSTLFLLWISLYIYCITKLLIFFVIAPDYLINCVEIMKTEFLNVAPEMFKDEALIKNTIDSMELMKKPIAILSQMALYYPLKSIILGATIALIAKKKNKDDIFKETVN